MGEPFQAIERTLTDDGACLAFGWRKLQFGGELIDAMAGEAA